MASKLPAIQILEQANEKFVSIYQAVHKVDLESAQNFFEVEKFNFQRQIEESETLKKCTPLSVAGAFLEVISNGLSFDKASNHVYLIPRNVKVVQGWETRLTYSYAADGIVFLCTAAGSIKSCSNPVIVFEGDQIEVTHKDGISKVFYQAAIPRKSSKIIGGFCTVTDRFGQKEDVWVGIEEVSRLMGFSAKSNKGSANALYTSGDDGQIDTGFFKTKIVKLALKGKRRKKTLDENYIDDETPEFNVTAGIEAKEIEEEAIQVGEVEEEELSNMEMEF